MVTGLDNLNARSLDGIWTRLRPLDCSRDAAPLFAFTHGPEMEATWKEMKVGPFATAQAFAEHVAELEADPHRAFFTVLGPDDMPLGWLCLMEGAAAHRSIELGYVLYAPQMRRTRMATEAFYLMMRHVFDDLGYHRLEWTCTAANAISRRAAMRLGFQFEGIMRGKLILKGQTRDIAMYSLLANEWPGRKMAFEDWLDPSNFDGEQQRRPLTT
jgi:RimJ/RimL family protein N-acetyltransferase